MAIDYYVDADSGSDANGGTGWGDAKQHISAAIDDLITDVITDTVTIHLKSSTTNSYTDDVEIRGITCIGSDARLVIQPENWDETKYGDASGDPLGGAGDFDPKTTPTVELELKLTVTDSTGIELRGLCFLGEDVDAGIEVAGQTSLTIKYSRIEGQKAGLLSRMGPVVMVENCYFLDNITAVSAFYKSQVILSGSNYIEDAVYWGLGAMVDSTVVVVAWPDHQFEYYTTEIKTTTPRTRQYSGMKAVAGSTICVQDETLHPMMPLVAHVHIRNDHHVLKTDYYGVQLDSGSLLTGGDGITFTTLDAKGDAVDMPEVNRVVVSPNGGTVAY